MRCDEDILLVKSEAWDKKYTFPEKILESYGSIGENIKKISSSIYVELEEYDTTKPICILEFLDKKQRKGFDNFVLLFYLCKAKNKEVKIKNNDFSEAIWIKPKDASNYDIESYSKICIEKLEKSAKKHFLKKIYEKFLK